MTLSDRLMVIYNIVPVDTKVKLYRWIENVSICCAGISFGNYWSRLLNGKVPRHLDLKISENNVIRYLLPELHRACIGVTGKQIADNTYEFWFIDNPSIKATLVTHPDFVGRGKYCRCHTCTFENMNPDSTLAYVWMDESEQLIQELTTYPRTNNLLTTVT